MPRRLRIAGLRPLMRHKYRFCAMLCTGLLWVSALFAHSNLLFDSTGSSENLAPQVVVEMPEVVLRARPSSCITLREGLPCFVKLFIEWESTQPISACLVSDQNSAGECWEDALSGSFDASLYLTETTTWRFEDELDANYGSVQVSVSWIYDSRRVRRNWRLF